MCYHHQVIEVCEYLDRSGRSPFGNWFDQLEPTAAARVAVALTRIGLGNTSNVKSVGAGVVEYRIDYGPGYRIYFGRDGGTLVILLAGGSKKGHPKDVRDAKARWSDYKERKLRSKA